MSESLFFWLLLLVFLPVVSFAIKFHFCHHEWMVVHAPVTHRKCITYTGMNFIICTIIKCWLKWCGNRGNSIVTLPLMFLMGRRTFSLRYFSSDKLLQITTTTTTTKNYCNIIEKQCALSCPLLMLFVQSNGITMVKAHSWISNSMCLPFDSMPLEWFCVGKFIVLSAFFFSFLLCSTFVRLFFAEYKNPFFSLKSDRI